MAVSIPPFGIRRVPSLIPIFFAIALFPGVSFGQTVNWLGGSGDWSVPGNWSTGQVPTSSSDVSVTLAQGEVLTVSGAAQAGSLVFDGSLNIEQAGNLTVSGSAIMEGNWIHRGAFSAGAGSLVSSTITIESGTIAGSNLPLAGAVVMTATEQVRIIGTVSIEGTFDHQGSGKVGINNSSRLIIAEDGVYTFSAPAELGGTGVGGGASPIVDNWGTILRSGSDGLAAITVTFLNNQGGTIEASQGTLRIHSAGSSENTSFRATGSGVVDISPNQTHNYSGAIAGTGDGKVQLNSGDLIFAAGSVLNFSPGLFEMSGGEISGTVTNTGEINLVGDEQKRIGAILTNEGAINQFGAGILQVNNSSRLINSPTGIYSIHGEGGISSSGVGGGASPIVDQQGLLRKVTSAGTTLINVTYLNHLEGTIEVVAGTLAIASDGDSTGATFDISPGAELDISPASRHDYTGAYTGDGGGQVTLKSGNIYFSGESSLDFPEDYFVMTGGSLVGPVTNLGNLTFDGPDRKLLGSTLVNEGTLHLRGEGALAINNSTVLQNTANGSIIVYESANIERSGIAGGASPIVNHEGLLLMQGSASSISVTYFNHLGGTVDVQSGILSIASAGSSTGATFNVADGAELDISPTAGHDYSGLYTGAGGGQVSLKSGTIDFGLDSQVDFPPDYFVMTGGSLVGPVTNLGHLTFDGPDRKQLGSTVVNEGTLHLRGVGSLAINNSSVLQNTTNGTIVIHESANIEGSGVGGGASPIVNHEGLLRMQGTDSSISVTYFNHLGGTVDVQSGMLSIASAGSSTGATFNVADGAELDISPNSEHDYTGVYTGAGGGQVFLKSGMIDFGAGSQVDFPPDYFEMTGGILSGPVTNIGDLTFGGSERKRLNRTVVNEGTLHLRDTGVLAIDNSSVLENMTSGTIIVYESANIEGSGLSGGAAPIVNHAGTLLMQGSASAISVYYFNIPQGTIDVQSGELALQSRGTSSGATYMVAAGTTLDLTPSASYNYGEGLFRGMGEGTIAVRGGTLDGAGFQTFFDFDPGVLKWSGGLIRNITNRNEIEVLPNGNRTRAAGLFTNDGDIFVADGASLEIDNSARFVNRKLVELRGETPAVTRSGTGGGSIPVFRNESFVRRTGGDGVANFGVRLDLPYTTLSIEQGDLILSGGGEWFDPEIYIAETEVLSLTGGTFNLNDRLTFSGGGGVTLNGAFLVGKDAVLDAPEGLLTMLSGSLSGSPGLANDGYILLDGPESKTLNGSIYNAGIIENTGDGGLFLTNFYNQADGIVDLGGSPPFLSGSLFENQGVFVKSGPGETELNFSGIDQLGTLESAHGVLRLGINGTEFFDRDVIKGGRYISSGGVLAFPENIDQNEATLEWKGAGASIIGLDEPLTNRGALVVRDGASPTIAHPVTNTGIIDVDEASSLSIQGTFTNSDTSAIILGIGGSAADNRYGQIIATGNATLAGLIKLDAAPDFNPVDDDRFPLITFSASSGVFTSLVGFESSPSLIVAPLYEPTQFVLVAEEDAADLEPTFATLPEMLVPGEPATIVYDLANNGTDTAVAPWRDSIFLSLDDQFDIDDTLLARVDQDADLSNGSSRPVSLTLNIPGILPGEYYVIVTADSRQEVLDFDRASNTVVSATPIPLEWKRLTLGEFVSGDLEPGESDFYQFEAPALAPLRVQLDSQASEGTVKAFLRSTLPPTPWIYDGAGEEPAPDQDFSTEFNDDIIANDGIDFEASLEVGQRFLQILPESLPEGSTSFDLLVEEEAFRLIDSQPKVADSASSVTLRIAGMQLPANTILRLTNGLDSRTGTGLFRVSSEEIYATFDLRGLPAGMYRLEAVATRTELIIESPDEGNPVFAVAEEEFTSALIDALEVVAEAENSFIAEVATTRVVRAGRNMDVIITYQNAGTGNLDAPLLVLYSNPPVSFANVTDGVAAQPSPLQLLAIPSDGPAGILRPGSEGRIHLRGRAPITEGPLGLQLFQLYDDGSGTSFRAFLNSIALNNDSETSTLVRSELFGELGDQWQTYAQQLAARATALSADERRTHSVVELLEGVALTVLEPTEFPPPLGPGDVVIDNPFDLARKMIPVYAPTRAKIISDRIAQDCSTIGLPKDLALITAAAVGFEANLAFNASNHLAHFIGLDQSTFPPDCSQVNDINYGPDSDLAQEVREWTEAERSFQEVNLKYKGQVRDRLNTIMPNITAGITETSSFTVPDFNGTGLGGNTVPLKLSFYEKGMGGTFTPSTTNGSAFNLQAGFGGMQSAEGIIRDLEVEVEIIGECKIATYSGIIEYTWTDAYEFDQNDVGKSTFDRAAACLVLNGWACNFATSITIQEAFSGRVVLEGDGENCDGAPGEEEGEDPEDPEPPEEGEDTPEDPDDDIPVPDEPEDTDETDVVRSTDPNDILGPKGVPDQNYVRAGLVQDYIIRFENIATASAAAQEVFIDLPLDEDFDLSTFELIGYGFSGRDFLIENGPAVFAGRVLLDPEDPEGLIVDLETELDLENRLANWTFTTLDSKTGDYPADPFAGFLPPNNVPPVGEGYVAFRVYPRAGAPSGTHIDAEASIVFDLNEAIVTPPYFNTLDAGPPEAFFVTPSGERVGPATTIEWSANDNGGSGAATYDVYVAEGDGPLGLWLSETPDSSAVFTGELDAVYRFAVVARDRVGFKQAAPTESTLTITLVETLGIEGFFTY